MKKFSFVLIILIDVIALCGVAWIIYSIHQFNQLDKNINRFLIIENSKYYNDDAIWDYELPFKSPSKTVELQNYNLCKEYEYLSVSGCQPIISTNTEYLKILKKLNKKNLNLKVNDKPKVILIIDDIGVNVFQSLIAISLPKNITLSFLPYSSKLDSLLKAAINSKHSIMMHLPMQPINSNFDPGPNSLNTIHNNLEVNKIVEKNFKRFNKYIPYIIAVNNHMGSKFMQVESGLYNVLKNLKNRNVYFLDSLTGPDSKAKIITSRLKMLYLERDIFLDLKPEKSYILKQWNLAIQLAHHQGTTIVIAHPYPTTLKLIPELIKIANKSGVELISLKKGIMNILKM